MHAYAVMVALAVILAPVGVKAAELVVWWDEGANPEEATALKEIIAAFEQHSGKQVQLVLYEQSELPDNLKTAIAAARPPDIAFGILMSDYISEWALEDQLVDLTETVGHFSGLFDPDALAPFMLLNNETGQRSLYAVPIGRASNHVHVWKSLLEQAGFTLEDIPKQWDSFWSFWCDRVQPAVRRATGRDGIWGVGLNMSGKADTRLQFFQFINAYRADYVTRDGRLVIDDPEVRRKLIKAVDAYTAIYLEGCTPPDSVTWGGLDNNQKFLAHQVVMTLNDTLSIPNALKQERPEDYYENTATIEWPLGPDGAAFPIRGAFYAAAVFKDGRNGETAKAFVRFLVAEGWLAHYLDFSAERFLPPMPKLLDAPFWLDPSDPHRMASVMQIASRPTDYDYATVTGDWRYDLAAWQENVWGNAVHRVVTEGISPEQAVDEAIARIKEILAE